MGPAMVLPSPPPSSSSGAAPSLPPALPVAPTPGAPGSTRVIAGALNPPARDARHPTVPDMAGPVLSDALRAWLAPWHPGRVIHYPSTGPVIEELAHDRWLSDWFDGVDATRGHRSPGWAAATRALAGLPLANAPDLIWLAEPTHLHVATDHLILLHGAADTLSRVDADALAHSVAPMFEDANLGFRRLEPRFWIVWPGPARPSTSTAASRPAALPARSAPPASGPDGPPAEAPARRISVKVVGQARDRTAPASARPDETTTAASAAAAQGHSVDLYLPRGTAGRTLRQVANAAQMAWHEHPVNLARVANGLPVLNSLWFTGPTTPAEVASFRDRLAGERVTIDDGPLLARLRDDGERWQQELAAALTRAAEDPNLQRLVFCGEQGVREFVRRPPGASTDPGPGLLSRLGRLASQLGRRLTGSPATERATDPSTWFVEPDSPDLKRPG